MKQKMQLYKLKQMERSSTQILKFPTIPLAWAPGLSLIPQD